ncbi:MAG: hypothetical protein DRG78_03230 [Epsilonproteobacteria bacterium]|nr:MAG: hypothetical protein DRG78_03230 [Campylobacterota bacterium]
MMDIVMSLVFSAPILIIMIYPAMKITEFIESKIDVNEKLYNKLTVIITILLSLIFGVLLQIT